MKTIIYGNWKMNQSLTEVKEFSQSPITEVDSNMVIGIAPQILHLSKMKENSKGTLKIGAQNCSHKISGAFTGETSLQSLKEAKADFVIIGHSERRALYGETNQTCSQKIKLAQSLGIEAVYCIGESLEQRESSQTLNILKQQILEGLSTIESLDGIILAYEPVWAIGTGKSATSKQAQEVHSFIRKLLQDNFKADCPILYGGSVKPANVSELMKQPDINGALVGGASLKLDSFISLCKAAKAE